MIPWPNLHRRIDFGSSDAVASGARTAIKNPWGEASGGGTDLESWLEFQSFEQRGA